MTVLTTPATSWTCGQRVISLDTPCLVGIVNVTPDSFSDGGQFLSVDDAFQHAKKLIQEGASILDIGGESTRPGASRVDAATQIDRVIPVIKAIREQYDVVISIDTTLAQVASQAVQAGASIINDVSAGEEDQDIFSLAAQTGVGLVLMHRRLEPEQDRYSNEYSDELETENIVDDVIKYLLSRVSAAIHSGVKLNRIAIDPGLGFGKSVNQNWQIVEQISRFHELGCPIYLGASRKSFIGAMTQIEEPRLRDEVSAVVAFEMATKGAQIFRVHDVIGHARMLQSLSSIKPLQRS